MPTKRLFPKRLFSLVWGKQGVENRVEKAVLGGAVTADLLIQNWQLTLPVSARDLTEKEPLRFTCDTSYFWL